ncbi:MAG: hypothetical protein SGPRY_013418, partial [Prymnesium sp.]
ARVIWLTTPANHIVDDPLDCSTSKPAHQMSWHRSQLFSALGAEAMQPTVRRGLRSSATLSREVAKIGVVLCAV